MNILLSIDAGTTAFKAALYNEQLSLVAFAQRDYTLLTSENAWVEFDAGEYRQLLFSLIRELLAKSNIAPRFITSLSVSSQGETLICLDAHGNPLRRAIVWLDNRAVREADMLGDHFGRESVYTHTGQADMLATWPAAKILWLKKHEPEVFRNTAHFLLLEDYLIFCLTGRIVGEATLWASSALWDVQKNCWWADMLTTLELPESKFPVILPCATPVAPVCPHPTHPLTADTLVVTGALDQSCSNLGAGLAQTGCVAATLGSCLAVNALRDCFVPWIPNNTLTCQPSPVQGQWSILLFAQTAGMTLKWFARNFYTDAAENIAGIFESINIDAQTIPAGSDGLIMLPHLSGASCPEFNSNARGVFYGITLQHTRAHFARSVMESVGYMLRRMTLPLQLRQEPLYLLGGGAQSVLWCQIIASINHLSVSTLDTAQTSCRGAAMLAGVGAGIFPSIQEAARTLLHPKQTFLPSAQDKTTYDRCFALYESLSDALEPCFSKWSNE